MERFFFYIWFDRMEIPSSIQFTWNKLHIIFIQMQLKNYFILLFILE